MFSKKFWVDTVERVIRTGAQALLATLTTTTVDWGQKLQITGIAMIAALLTAVVASGAGSKEDASFLKK